jgi:hypothetical protein
MHVHSSGCTAATQPEKNWVGPTQFCRLTATALLPPSLTCCGVPSSTAWAMPLPCSPPAAASLDACMTNNRSQGLY